MLPTDERYHKPKVVGVPVLVAVQSLRWDKSRQEKLVVPGSLPSLLYYSASEVASSEDFQDSTSLISQVPLPAGLD